MDHQRLCSLARATLLLLLLSHPAMPADGRLLLRPAPLLDPSGALLPPEVVSAPITAFRSAPISPLGSAPGAPADFPLNRVAETYPCLYQQATFGDTDHDGRNEVIVYVNDNNHFHYRILEEQGNNVYSDEYSGAALLPYAVSDLDRDGKSEIIGQQGFYIYVYESADAATYPTNLVWTSPSISNVVGYTMIGDSDRDGRAEIIHSLNPFFGDSELFIFENSGDNSFTQVYHTIVGPGANGEKVIGDFDGDGLTEIAFCGVDGDIYVYESSADNTWARTWTASTGMTNAYAAEWGKDTDGNGTPELFLMGNSALGWTTHVYEAVGDNQFAFITSMTIADGYVGLSCNALGDLDGLGTEEYLMQGHEHFCIYAPSSPGHWSMIQEYQNPPGDIHYGLQTFDANRNDRTEIFYDIETNLQYGWQSWVLEHPVAPTAVDSPQAAPARTEILAFPSPFATSVTFRYDLAPGELANVQVFDVMGRHMRTISSAIQGPGAVAIAWDGRDEQGREVGSGTYYWCVASPRGARMAKVSRMR
jgi:hypothetical protein